MELDEFSIRSNLQYDLEFASQLPYVMKELAKILSKFKYKYLSRTHKYGLCIPKSNVEGNHIDEEKFTYEEYYGFI